MAQERRPSRKPRKGTREQRRIRRHRVGLTGPQQFGWIHEIACPSDNVLYVAELLNWRVQKLILHP